jgi:hypothetical protein
MNKEIPQNDTRPDWMKNNEVGASEVEHEGRKILYTIVDKSLEPKLPGFMGYLDGEHLFISEEVPDEFRIPQLVHEIIEFTELKDQKGRCLEALKRELKIVPDNIKPAYLKYRTIFFEKLIEYYKNSKKEDFKTEIRASYDFLKELS